jgi:hypothetical protein
MRNEQWNHAHNRSHWPLASALVGLVLSGCSPAPAETTATSSIQLQTMDVADLAVGVNVALGRPAFQWPEPDPSTWWVSPASRAVDGDTNGDWWHGSVTHTDFATGPWWWVDLGSVQHIHHINLFNRTDCCASRLSHYQVYVSADSTDGWDGSWPLVVDRSNLDLTDDVFGSFQFLPVNDVSARWVAVTLADSNYLSLAEVEVWAF